MKRKNATRSALITSIISLLLCVSMLVSTTFAWFTDEVVSGNNVIAAGNLDIELDYAILNEDGTVKEWATVKDATNLFSGELWEPGHTEVVYLRLANKGTLDLKYYLSINVEETTGINVFDKEFKLSDYIYMGVAENAEPTYTTRADAIKAAKEGTNGIIGQGFAKSGTILDGAADLYMAVVVYMPEETDNNANYKTGTTRPEINLGLNLFATQLMSENDSFGSDYDAGAAWTGDASTDWYFADPTAETFTIESAEDLAGLAAIVNGTATAPATTFALRSEAETVQDTFNGKTIKLANDIDLRNIPWTPIGRIGVTSTDFTYSFRGTFDGQGHTISNLEVSNEGWAGVFGIAYKADINNLTVDTASIRSNRMAGAIVGQLYGSIDNCHVANAEIVVIPNAVGDSYDNGDKVGGIVGWLGDNGNNRTLTKCSATDVKITAYRDVAAIAGYVASSTTVSDCKVTKAEIAVDQITNYYGDKDYNAGLVYGRTGGTITDTNNTTDEESTVIVTYSKDGLTLKQNGVTGETTLYLVPADYAEATVTVPEGVTNIGSYAFAYNANVEKIVLPSTVTTLNDRAFRDTAASTVVLNEGLKNISYQAFRNATNVESVEIPSTVETIYKEAFQNSGIKSLTIPATVTTLEYGACRDMKMVETVVIESNADIPVYAFRACTNLKTVILTGENVTFGGGSRGMIFTNKENGDGSAITIYVANEEVKERLLAADTAAKDYGGYKIVVAEVTVVDTADKLVEALEKGEDVFLTDDVKIDPAGMSNAYGTTGINVKNGQTIDGNGNVLDIKGAGGTWDSGISTTGGVIKNITVTGSFRGIFVNHNSDHSEKVVLENVIIDGTTYTISCDQGTNQGLEATNSTFKGWTSYAATLGNAKFVDCSFGYGNGYAYCRPYAPTAFVGCDFEAGYRLDPRAAVSFENCTIGGVALTAENLATLVTNTANATVK